MGMLLAAAHGWALAADAPANASFELPKRAAGEPPARGQVSGWQAQQGGVALNDGSWGAVLKGVDGEQVGYLSAAANSQMVQDLGIGLTPRSQHVFGINVGLRSDAPPPPGSSMALRLQTLDDAGRPLANLAIVTLIVGRETLSAEELNRFEVTFTTGESAPPGRVRLMMDVVEPSKDGGFWVVDAASWEVSSRAAAPAAVATVAAKPATLGYSKDIVPILAENCFACHGPDPATREARLRLDVREVAITPNKDGRTAIVPGNPSASGVLKRITTTDPDEVMPPPESHKTLTKEQIAKIRTWIEEGAVYQKHWAYEPIARPPLPVVQKRDWVRQPLDAFVLAKLEANRLAPAPEAERHTLARRAALDLTGLPPAPEMLDEFLADKSADAYERYVDRLLALPSWGEHRARYWLDVARYADTHGIHFDNYREIWGYRDWVIKAFNRNLPFDQFTIEQLAGDMLPGASADQLIATGYNRCNISTNEGGVIEEEYRVLYSIDRADTMARAWLGLTAACASCHDHKFDPLPTKDFYSLAAFFNNSTTSVMDGNVKDPPPTHPLLEGADRKRWDELAVEIPAAEEALRGFSVAAEKRFEARMAEGGEVLFGGGLPNSGLVYQAELAGLDADGALAVVAQGKPAQVRVARAPAPVDGPTGAPALTLAEPGLELPGLAVLETNKPFSVGLWVKVDDLGQTGSLLARMDDEGGFRGFDIWFAGGAVGTHILRSFPDDCIKVVAEGPGLQAKRWHHVMLSYDGSAKAVGTRIFIDGVEQRLRIEVDNLRGSIATEVPLRLGRREHRDAIRGLSVAGLRVYDRVIGRDEVNRLAVDHGLRGILAQPAEKRKPAERKRLLDAYLVRVEGAEYGELVDRVAKLKAELETIRTRTPATLVFKEAETLPTAYVLNRGQYDQRRDLVAADTPGALPAMAGDLPRNRLGLAKWLVSSEQPLTARVTVNRFWLEIFGQGIVATPGDFGLSGQTPSHPELLDWLASELRESGWDMKKFYRMLVTSATYRQAAVFDAERLEKDPSNILLSRGPRFRMDAEMIRDSALFTSGLLVPKLGGPSVKPYQPDGVWEAVAMFESNTRNYKRDKGDALYRRSMYTFWKRSAPPAAMEVFNAPSRETCTIQRERGNTPLQALASLNDPQLTEAARNLAQRAILANPGADADAARIEYMTKRLIARSMRPEELAVVSASLEQMRGFYAADPAAATALLKTGVSPVDATVPAPELAAWTLIANQLMNLDEVLAK
jgi:mono/diheme cytochrome c family protein